MAVGFIVCAPTAGLTSIESAATPISMPRRISSPRSRLPQPLSRGIDITSNDLNRPESDAPDLRVHGLQMVLRIWRSRDIHHSPQEHAPSIGHSLHPPTGWGA